MISDLQKSYENRTGNSRPSCCKATIPAHMAEGRCSARRSRDRRQHCWPARSLGVLARVGTALRFGGMSPGPPPRGQSLSLDTPGGAGRRRVHSLPGGFPHGHHWDGPGTGACRPPDPLEGTCSPGLSSGRAWSQASQAPPRQRRDFPSLSHGLGTKPASPFSSPSVL